MLIATLLSALALTAPAPSPWSCDLAPSIGQGSSDEGRIDGITAINFGCRYELFHVMGLGISPVLGIDKQLWSVYQKSSSHKDIRTYETQDFNFGFRLDKALSRELTLFYGLLSGQGKGTLNLTQSTDQSSLSSSYSDLKQSYLQHSLGASYALTAKLSLSLAWQRQTARQSWSADNSQTLLQNIDEENHLSLSSGLTLLGTPLRNSSNNSSNLIQLGLSFNFSP